MRSFKRLSSRLVPLAVPHVDTDQIIPASFLKVTDRSGLGDGLFAGWRFENGAPVDDFVLNLPQHAGAEILLAGKNFGCGSSREHAVWALVDYGFRAVVSTRFADIFRSDALKNGLLPVEVAVGVVDELFAAVEADPGVAVTIDLETRELVLPGDRRVVFPVDPFSRHCLLRGIDSLGYLLDQLPRIEAWEAARPPRIDTRQTVAGPETR